jgi:murein DD-endopeptidase MepM/ murein hydrolase activator NlpD
MQCSESPYNTKYPREPNSITDPEYSINVGVEYFASCLSAAKCKSPQDISGISLALQGYNYGGGYIAWAIKRDGGYTQGNAQVFSEMKKEQLGTSVYGNPDYAQKVLSYYNSSESGGFSYPIQKGLYSISSPFGIRLDPMTGKTENHKGVDFAAPLGTPIHAGASGTVIYAQFGSFPYGGYGNVVVIRHSSSLISLYGHCSKLLVAQGQTVQQGQEIALVGSTGDSTGNHCHFEIRQNNNSVDPINYLK